MLRIDGLTVGYGGSPVLHEVSLTVATGEFVAVVGSNGAGKTTLFKAISGIVPALRGTLHFDDVDLAARPAYARAHLGIAHVPEGRQIFPGLTVAENIAIGATPQAGRRAWQSSIERIHSWFPVLADRAAQLAGTLSGGEQQMLAIARGLAGAPRLLLLDEPSMGLAPMLADEIFERIVDIHRQTGLSVLLVEQRVAEALHFADRAYVLETGRVVLSGTREELANHARIKQAYLGM